MKSQIHAIVCSGIPKSMNKAICREDQPFSIKIAEEEHTKYISEVSKVQKMMRRKLKDATLIDVTQCLYMYLL